MIAIMLTRMDKKSLIWAGEEFLYLWNCGEKT